MNNNRPSFFQNTHQGSQQGSGQFTNPFSTNNNVLPSIGSLFPQHFPQTQTQPQQYFQPQQQNPQQQFFQSQQQSHQQQFFLPQQQTPQQQFFLPQQQTPQKQFFLPQQQTTQQQFFQPQQQNLQQQFFLPQQQNPQQQFFQSQQQSHQQQFFQPQQQSHQQQFFLPQQQNPKQQFFQSQQQSHQQQFFLPQQQNPQQQFFQSQQQSHQQQFFLPQQQNFQQQFFQSQQQSHQQQFTTQQFTTQQNPQQTYSQSFQSPLLRQNTNQQTLQVLPTPMQQQRVTTLQSQPFDFSKLDLKSSVNEAGLWQMDTSRRQDLSQQLSQFLGTNSPSPGIIRIDSQKTGNETWGNSADENVRTQFLRDNRRYMRKDEAETSFNQRSHQGTLIWKTDSPVLSTYGEQGDDSQLLSGHTPGLKTKQVPGTSGALTKEHGRRDILRQGVVDKTLSDGKRGDHDLAIVSKLATIQLMMSPKEEIEQVKSNVQGGGSMFSQFKDIGDISGKQGNFDPFTQRVQYVREKEKMHAAKNLLIRGFDNLVPDNHRKLLSSSGGDVDKAMQTLIGESQSKTPSITFNTATSSQTDRLDQNSLREMSQKTSGRPRALSDPRRVDTKPFNF